MCRFVLPPGRVLYWRVVLYCTALGCFITWLTWPLDCLFYGRKWCSYFCLNNILLICNFHGVFIPWTMYLTKHMSTNLVFTFPINTLDLLWLFACKECLIINCTSKTPWAKNPSQLWYNFITKTQVSPVDFCLVMPW